VIAAEESGIAAGATSKTGNEKYQQEINNDDTDYQNLHNTEY
jgi:hypothetical protein